MVVPFGFSISDFIAITELTIKICRFTSASSGLRREVQTLASQYYELYELMQKAMGIHIQQDIDLEPSSKRCLEYHLSRCREHLRQFEQEITAITRASNADSVAKKAKQTGARLKLMIMHDSVLKKLNANFRHDLEAFKLCVDAVTAGSQEKSRICLLDLTKNHEKVHQTLNTLVTMFGTMPKDLGYTWEGGELKRHITLIHATGEERLIPLDLWSSFERFHGLLMLEKTYPGHKHMSKHHYQLIDCSNGLKVDAGDEISWQTLARPGAKVMLSVAMGTWQKWRSTGKYCPKCAGEELTNAVLSGWRRCDACDLEFNSLDISHWHHPTEPIDTNFPWYSHAQGEPSIDTGLPLEQAQALQDDSTGTPDQPDHTQAPSPTPTPRTDPHDEDRESDLKRVTIVYSPIFSLVYRAASCMCRISGDESPFIESCDIMIWTPCRLHFPQAVAKALDVELEYPPQGYDPNEDPYFDRFGGRPAFVAWIATNTLVQKAIDVGTLLPEGMTWYEAARQLRIAGANESQKEALLDWQVQYHRQYIEWKSRYGKASDEKKAEMALRAKRGGAGPALERRGSF